MIEIGSFIVKYKKRYEYVRMCLKIDSYICKYSKRLDNEKNIYTGIIYV